MQEISLNGAWTLNIGDAQENVQAEVPGSVYHDLLTQNKMEDPYWRDNEKTALPIMENDFTYSRLFTLEPEFLQHETIYLQCKGLDTVTDIYVNDIWIAHTENMHRTWEFNVGKALRAGQNSIRITFASPTKWIQQMYAVNRADGVEEAMVGFPTLRKAHCMFGWDWGPRLPDCGIWRDISFLGVRGARVCNVFIRQRHQNDVVFLDIVPEVEYHSMQNDALQQRVVIKNAAGIEVYCGEQLNGIAIKAPQLWWPNGYGQQPLYTVEYMLLQNDAVLDSCTKRIGLRTVTMNTQKDEYGENFAHQVNGVCIFAMGADYIPEDCLNSRMNEARTRKLLEQCKAVNMNVVRVWGGGVYPADYFFDICDELGLLVWHDFMFACAVYNLTEHFEENIIAEITDNVKRIRHHACLGLWCGNNEMEYFVDIGEWVSTHRQKADYIKMYEYIFPKLLRQLDPDTYYWPASPSSGGSFDNPADPNRGDVHYWDVWNKMEPNTQYRTFYFRYISEFGFQSYPCMRTIEAFTLPEDRKPFTFVMDRHQRKEAATQKIMYALSHTYQYPTSFEAFTYVSQLLQADAIRYGVEHWRRHRGRCMGAIYWQLNDIWPAVSWASIDYFGRWKALHYAAKRFFVPVLLSCHEESMVTQTPNINAELVSQEKSATLNISNETMVEFVGEVKWRVCDAQSVASREGAFAVRVPALSAQWYPTIDLTEIDAFSQHFYYELFSQQGDLLSSDEVLFCQPKYYQYENPKLSARIAGDEVIVTASAFASKVWLKCDTETTVFEDNYFAMERGERAVKIISGTPSRITAYSLYDAGC